MKATIQTLVLIWCIFIFHNTIGVFGTFDSYFVFQKPIDEHWYTIVTNIYTHFEFSHLIGNSIYLLIGGILLERYTTVTRYHIFFILSGSFGALSEILISYYIFEIDTGVIGASGAIFAIFGYLITSSFRRHLFENYDVSFFKKIILTIILIFCVVLMSLGDNIAIYAHIFGFIFGMIAGRINLLSA